MLLKIPMVPVVPGEKETNKHGNYAPVICITGSPGAGDSGDIAGLKCLALTSDVSRQCRGFAGVMISRQYTVTLIQIRF